MNISKELTYLRQLPIALLYNKPKQVKKELKRVKKLLKDNSADLTKLTEKQRKSLGFCTWSEEGTPYNLIPLYIFNLLPKSTLLNCPLRKENKPEEKKDCGDDIRFGCVAYEFYNK